MKTLIGRKIGMTQTTDEAGVVTPITLIQAGPCVVTQIKTTETDGYDSYQLGFGQEKKANKPQTGHTKKLKTTPKVLREFRVEASQSPELGQTLDVDVFELGDKTRVTAISKGKGFAGTVKRHNFSRGPVSHGSQNVRKPGSIGSMYPQRIFKGKKMAGQMGANQVSVKNLKVAFIDKDDHLIGLSGAVPGPSKAVVVIEGIK